MTDSPQRFRPTPFPSVDAVSYGQDQYGCWQELQLAGIATRFRWIAPGEYLRGSPKYEKGRFDDERQHQVILTRGFWLAETACSQALWRAVTREEPSHFKGDELPVETVSWEGIQSKFIEPLSSQMRDLKPCLPSEAQWEYACRAGTTTAFSWGDEIDLTQARYSGKWSIQAEKEFQKILKQMEKEDRASTGPTLDFQPNSWGLYQLHGNVWEWCEDWYTDYPEGSVVDPTGPEQAPDEGVRVLRGGAWNNLGRILRSAHRDANSPASRGRHFGFRLAQVPVSIEAEPTRGA